MPFKRLQHPCLVPLKLPAKQNYAKQESNSYLTWPACYGMLLFCKVGGIILVTVRLSGARWHTKHQTNIKQPTNNPCQMLAVRRCQAKSPAAALSSGSGVSPRGWHHLAPGSWQLATLRCISVSQDPIAWESPGLCALNLDKAFQ